MAGENRSSAMKNRTTDIRILLGSVRIQKWNYLFIIFSDSAAQCGLLPPRSRGFVITHSDAPQSVGILWTSDQLVAETST
jgi:hypothetical protein